MKMTKARRAIMDILAIAAEPLSAASVYTALRIPADQATVYRTLHFLEEKGFADSFILHCADHGTERYYTIAPESEGAGFVHRHWFHCEECHKFTDLGDCRLSSLVSDYEEKYGIAVRTHTLYMTGVCAKCRHREKTPDR